MSGIMAYDYDSVYELHRRTALADEMSRMEWEFRSLDHERWRFEKTNCEKVFDLLLDKLSEIAEKTGYQEHSPKSCQFYEFDSAWTEYLEGLEVSRTIFGPMHQCWQREAVRFYKKSMVFSDFYSVSDPLYVTGRFIKIPKELAFRVLVLGVFP